MKGLIRIKEWCGKQKERKDTFMSSDLPFTIFVPMGVTLDRAFLYQKLHFLIE